MALDADLILVGGGLANGLLALRLRQRRPDLRLLIVEQGDTLGGNHTWSFHQHDLTPAQHRWLEPMVSKRWPGYEVIFPDLQRRLGSGYASIFSERFHQYLMPELSDGVTISSSMTAKTFEVVHSLTRPVLSQRIALSKPFVVAKRRMVAFSPQLVDLMPASGERSLRVHGTVHNETDEGAWWSGDVEMTVSGCAPRSRGDEPGPGVIVIRARAASRPFALMS